MAYGLIILGLLLLFLGGEALVRGSVGIARKFGLSELLIGLTLVGFGTSVPELVTSVRAVNLEAVGMSVGNVAGSNIANMLLVLGVAAVMRPIVTNPRALGRDFSVMTAATLVFVGLVYWDQFSRLTGFILIALLLVYVVASFLADQKAGDVAGLHADESELIEADDTLPISILLALGGIVGVLIGARFLVSGGVQLAAAAGVSETLIGLTIVAIGTSLPELATCIVSSLRGKSDVALGNVLGSNIFNAVGIVGATAAIHPFSLLEGAGRTALDFDYTGALDRTGGAMGATLDWTDVSTLILSVFLVGLFALTGKRLARWEGGVLLLAYALYMGLLFNFIPTPFS